MEANPGAATGKMPQQEMPKKEDVRNFIDQSATRLVEQANEGLRNLSERLRDKDLDEILRDAESFARRQPAVFIGAAAIAGFLAVRFLKSSSQRDYRST